jgi:hypothetical protein
VHVLCDKLFIYAARSEKSKYLKTTNKHTKFSTERFQKVQIKITSISKQTLKKTERF